MHEREITEAVSKWLSSLFPCCTIHADEEEIKVYEVENGYSVGYKLTNYIRVGCKEGLTEYYGDLGRCLTYCVENGYVPTYFAVPHDYPNRERLERAVNAVKLPIGLLTVDIDGRVKVAIKPHLL